MSIKKRETMSETADQRIQTFTLQEAFDLIEVLVIKINANKKKGAALDIGVVSGVLNVNEEIEIVIKFLNGLNQYTKQEFEQSFRLIDDDE